MGSSNESVLIKIPDDVSRRLAEALRKAGSREIGGILMGEHVSENTFVVRDISIQRQGDTFASFVRAARQVLGALRRFFAKTGYDYTRCNYLGEWHSHPSFSPMPSTTDCETMWSIVEDPGVGANFAVLMIVRLHWNGEMEGSATVFLPQRRMLAGSLLPAERVL